MLITIFSLYTLINTYLMHIFETPTYHMNHTALLILVVRKIQGTEEHVVLYRMVGTHYAPLLSLCGV